MPLTTSEKTPAHSWRFEALGTRWEISSSRLLSEEQKSTILKEIEAFDTVYSRFRGDSVVQAMAKSAGEYSLPESADAIFSLYEQLYELTLGKVTPLVGDVLADAGYDAEYSLQPKSKRRPVPQYDAMVSRKGSHLSLKEPVMVDIGAIGKGYLVDYLSELLRKSGHSDFVVDGSGDMRVVGARPETVGLENPLNTEEVIGAIRLLNASLCASANNRRAWGDWHHIIDPDTAAPTRDIIATWVIADTAMIADGLSTALFFVPPQILAKKYNYEYMRMFADGSIEYSDYFAEGVY